VAFATAFPHLVLLYFISLYASKLALPYPGVQGKLMSHSCGSSSMYVSMYLKPLIPHCPQKPKKGFVETKIKKIGTGACVDYLGGCPDLAYWVL
jgi:hypothetical protein